MNDTPQVIRTLKDYLWYLRGNEQLVVVPKGDGLVSLKSLGPEEWAETVANWILNYQIPAALEPLDEAEQAAVQQINRGGAHCCRDDGGYPDDRECFGGGCGTARPDLWRDPADLRRPPDVPGCS